MQFSRCLRTPLFRWLSCEVPPVPIPNTEVKLTYTDNTWLATAREDRQPPGPQRVTPLSDSFLLSHSKRKLSSFSFLNFIQLCAFLFRAPFFFCYGQNIVETSLRLVSHCFARASPRFICHRQRSAPHSPKRKRNRKREAQDVEQIKQGSWIRSASFLIEDKALRSQIHRQARDDIWG